MKFSTSSDSIPSSSKFIKIAIDLRRQFHDKTNFKQVERDYQESFIPSHVNTSCHSSPITPLLLGDDLAAARNKILQLGRRDQKIIPRFLP